MCLYPRIIINPKYKANKKNGGEIPLPKDRRTMAVPIGCGNCIECKKQKAREWQVRLAEEIRTDKSGKFVTLTFSDEALEELGKEITTTGYEKQNDIATLAMRRFLERWRKKHKKSVKHWAITELGGTRTERIHLHGIIFTEKTEDIKEIWKYGYTYVGEYVNDTTITYVSKYMHKTDIKHKEYNAKILTSAGIGRGYTDRKDKEKNKYVSRETVETYKTRTGVELALPKYYRNKIYTEEEREKLWIEKLDKQERYVLGKKIDISKGDEEYYKALEEARKKNKKMGYGKLEKRWEKTEYENQRKLIELTNKIQAFPPPEKGEC